MGHLSLCCICDSSSTSSLFRSPSPSVPQSSREASDAKKDGHDSEDSDSTQDVDTSDTDFDDGQQASSARLCRNDSGREESRQSSFVKTDTLHTSIINEMKNKGLLKRLAASGENLPSDVGKMRPVSSKANRHPCKSEPPVGPHPPESGDVRFRLPPIPPQMGVVSVISNSSGSTTSIPPDRDSDVFYTTGDEKEDKRLRDLHGIAREFYQMQKNYVELLENISQHYPKYIELVSKHTGKSLLATANGGVPHVVHRIARHLNFILGVHKMLLDDFAQKYAKWDSRQPNLAEVLQLKADFLKCCNAFLKEKRTLCAELQACLDENKELAYATKQFEDSVLNAPTTASSSSNAGAIVVNGSATSLRGISLVMHLDAVHQNVVRYKLLMERYHKMLPDTLVEAKVAEEALKKLNTVSQTVNGSLAVADAGEKLLDLHRKLQSAFDVFVPGRQLIQDGEVLRQCRKATQPRYLILFSDMLLICGYSLGSDTFDPGRLYQIPIERVRAHVQEHDDNEREFAIISPKKSSIFIAKSKLERDTWVQRLLETSREQKEIKLRRRSIAKRQKPQPTQHAVSEGSDIVKRPLTQQNSVDESPEVENRSLIEDVQPSTSSGGLERTGSRYEALWIPDNKASKCLMAGCDTKFTIINRKHHCRQCGWLICGRCVGYAPVKIKNYAVVKVCPQCYYEIKAGYESGALFPRKMLRWFHVEGNSEVYSSVSEEEIKSTNFSVNDSNLRVLYDEGGRMERPKDLFRAPTNGHLRKAGNPMDKSNEELLASGKVHLRTKKGSEVVRWARLTKEMFLHFYCAEFDDQPAETFFAYGYSLTATELDDSGMQFELVHRNQFQTERKEDRVIFRVANTRGTLHLKKAYGLEPKTAN
ncbi:Protein TAG-77 [Aphelenchoides avenae]|nr:Protein TAG-77 [Aphelenchus avenae]